MPVNCTYSQRTRRVSCRDAATGRALFNVMGYSGTGAGRDNPAENGTPYVGPTPRGVWQIGAAVPGSRKGPNSIRITHTGGEAFPAGRERNTFLIHGNNRANDASEGCSILGPAQRQIIVNNGGGTLTVTR